MAMINGTDFNGNNTVNGNGKFHKFLVGTIALVPLSLIGFSLGTVITAPVLALVPADGCLVINGGIPYCAGGGDLGGGDGGHDGFDPPLEPDPKPPNQPNQPKPKPPNQPKPKPPNQPKPDASICNKKPSLPQCN
jgi:hypothetical protein